MKLCRIGNVGEEKPAIIDQDNNFRDLSSLVEDLNPNTLNFENLDKGLKEIQRILKPGKKLIILETAVPSFFLFRLGYVVYTKLFVPFLGKIIANNQQAYNYLSNSAEQFPHGKSFKEILKKNQ